MSIRRNWLSIAVALVAVLALVGMAGAVSAAFPAQQNAAPLSAPAAANSGGDSTIDTFDCGTVEALGIDRQMNMRASLIMQRCGRGPTSAAPAKGLPGAPSLDHFAPAALGGTDVDVILPDGTYPKVTQSESMVWAHGQTIVNNYNDSRTSSGCYSGLSYSTDGGLTWHAGQPLCSGHGTNFGDPIVVWNNALNLWVAGDLATGCGGQGIGGWTSPDGITWTAGACMHNNSNDDRESFWVDNNPASPHYGRMYTSFANYNVGSGALQLMYSDNATTWTGPVTVVNGATFIRDVQITGDLGPSGTVYIAGMDEGGGGLNTRQNHMYRSTDGGATWTDSVMGPRFYPPGRSVSGYFAGMYASPAGYWRHMGWGQPAAVGSVVHYVYALGIQGTDPGNIMYQRSTDSGVTWSTPIQLNTDATVRAQWMPSLAVTAGGALYSGWYDERETASCGAPGANTPCYRRWGRVSLDNGVTWQADDTVGDVVSPLPNQPDSGVQPLYVGDYNYISSDGTNVYDTWTDGRVLISGNAQQDQFVDRIPLLQGTPTPTVTGTPPTLTPTRTFTQTPTATATPCQSSAIVNGGFETGSLAPWTVLGTNPAPVVSNALPHSGTYAALLGTLSGPEPLGDGSIYQTITVPAGGGTLSYWWNGSTTDTITFDWQDAYITDTSGTILATIMHNCSSTGGYVNQTFNMAPYAGQTVRVEFLVHQDGFGDDTAMYVDDVQLLTACGTVGPTNSPTPGGPTATVTATPTCIPQTGGWTDRAAVPTVGLVRADGAYWPATGLIYVMGGRTTDTAGDFNDTIYSYNPTTNAWATASGALTDTNTSNLAVAVLTGPSGPRIYAIGGAVAGTGVTPSGIVRIYDPATGTVTNGTPWPQNPPILPGGWSVFNNKLYIFGGFDPVTGGGATPPDIWVFDPATGGGTWTHSAAALSIGRGYAAVATIGNFIYIAGGSQFAAGTLTNEMITERFDPATNTICDACVADMPTASSNFKGYTDGTSLFAPGGFFSTAVATVQVYNAGTNTWSTTTDLNHPVRNYARATVGNTFYVIGGYDAVAGISTWNQRYTPSVACAGATPSPTGVSATGTPTTVSATHTATVVSATHTATAVSATQTPTVVATATVCPIQFTDVLPADPFYSYIRCLACRNIISGYTTTPPCATGQTPCYNGGANVTRGQVAKIVANAAGYADPIPSTTQTFTDVPYTNPFWVYIERLAEPGRGFISGYSTSPPCTTGTPCFLPFNNVTRGQMAKIDANAGGFFDAIPSTQQTFTDVPYSNPFWVYIERAALHGVISGYSTSPPCPGGTPCFLWANNLTRNQAAKVVAVTFYPNCQTPLRVPSTKPGSPPTQ